MPRVRWIRLALAAVLAALMLALAVGAGGWLARRLFTQPPAARPASLATVLPAPRALPEFVLTAADGTRLDRARLAGHYSLVFLGFTQCPDICPAALTTLAAANRTLGALPPRRRPTIVFISVDPAHDTPATLGAYVAHFDARFVGATGAEPALKTLAAALGAYWAPGSADSATRVVHSGALFLVDPEARLAAVYTSLPTPAALAADYIRVVDAWENEG